MNPYHVGSSRSDVVNEYVSISRVNDSRLDKLVGKRNGQTIEVSKSTFEMMYKAHNILLKTGYETFPDGPGNQKTNIWMSGGRSWIRMFKSRSNYDEMAPKDKLIQSIKQSGGGCCGEHISMVDFELKRIDRSMPAFEVHDSNTDHGYMIIGDWRDRNFGDKAIVVDAWQGIKKIHTYGERVNTSPPEVVRTVPAGPEYSLPPRMAAALSIKPEPNANMDERMQHKFGVKSGPEVAEKILKSLETANSLWDSVLSTKNAYTVYRDPGGNESAFNDIPASYINNYLNARNELLSKMPDNQSENN
ncbi:MAG: hypothetical protein P8Y45_06325 [Exilibacterium sp.]